MQNVLDGGSGTSLHNTRAFNAYTERMLMNSADGWMEDEILITTEDVPSLARFPGGKYKATFHHADVARILKEEYGKAEYQGHFALQYKEAKDQEGKRWDGFVC